jgi:hypothetical protein
MRRHVSYANVAATLALVFAMSGGAIAATGGFSSGGKLQGCVNEEGGLKLLKAGKHCRRGQKTVAWSITGPKGAKGDPGAPGAKGAAGANGGQGAQGPAGAPNPNATSVNGQSITRIFATVAPEAPAVNVLSTQGLTVQFSCPTSVEGVVTATGLAGGTDNLVWQGNGQSGAFEGRTEHLASTPSTIGKGNFGTGVAEFGTADGHVVSVTYGWDDASNGISSDCAIWGHATSG